jgi:uncharacterized membrane protein
MGLRALFLAIPALLAASSARADLQFCNKTSYVLDLALGLEERRGCVRIGSGSTQASKSVLQGTPEAEKVYVHAPRFRSTALAAARPPRRLLHRGRQFHHRGRKDLSQPLRPAAGAFSQIASETEQSLTAYLGEEADYDPAQAKPPACSGCSSSRATTPIRSTDWKAEDHGRARSVLKDRRLPADAANGATFFSVLLDARRN